MGLPTLAVKSFVFTPPFQDDKPALKMAAKCYNDGRQSKDGLTVLLAHGPGTRESFFKRIFPAAHNFADLHRQGTLGADASEFI